MCILANEDELVGLFRDWIELVALESIHVSPAEIHLFLCFDSVKRVIIT